MRMFLSNDLLSDVKVPGPEFGDKLTRTNVIYQLGALDTGVFCLSVTFLHFVR